MSTAPQIDYDALAQQHGGTAAPSGGVDYDALAAQHGGSVQPAANSDTGVMASLKRFGGGLIHLPGALYDAATKPPQNDDEKQTIALSGPGGLALKRLITDPMMAEHLKAQQLRAQAATQSPYQANNAYNGTQHLANMHEMASFIPVFGPMSADIAQRYLTGDKSGAVTDVVTNMVAPKVAEGVTGAVAKGFSKVTPAMASKFYESALKPSTTIPAVQRASIVQTGLDAGIPVSESGAAKLSGLIDDLNQKIKAQIQAGAKAGQTIDPTAVAQRVDQVAPKFANQVNPESDLAAIQASKDEFLRNNQNPIPVDEAQAMKQGTYAQLKGRAYGELKSATVESQKALARGIKEELETQFPEIKGMNAQESKFYGLDNVLERAVNRINNHQLIGIGTPIVAGATGGVAGAGPGVIAGVLKAVVDDPIVKSRMAIALSKFGKLPPAAANVRLVQFSNALAQSQQQKQDGQ